MESALSYMIALYTLYLIVRLYIALMQVGYVKEAKHREPVLLYPAAYMKAADYEATKQRLSMLSALVEYGLFFFWVTAGFAWLGSLLEAYSGIGFAVLFVNGVIIVNYLVGLPLDIYEKFVIDAKYGFNKSTFGLFAVDSIKQGALTLIFGSLIIAAVAYFVEHFSAWWIISFVFVFGVIILINMIYPTLIAPIFNTFTPLQNPELNEKIEELLRSVGFKSSGVYTIDASKRDSRLNAYFGGLGSTKRVVLFDTLVEKLTHDELLAVLGHELGHFKHGDIYKGIAVSGAMMLILFAVLGNLPEDLFTQMGVMQNGGTLIALFLLIASPLLFFLLPFVNYISRKNEFAADRFGSELKSADDLKRALIKLMNENKKFPKSHPLFVLFYYSHPSVLERIEAMGGMPDEADETAKAVQEKIDGIEFNIFETLGVEKHDGNH